MMTNNKIISIDIFCLLFDENMILIEYYLEKKIGQIFNLMKYSSLVSANRLFFLTIATACASIFKNTIQFNFDFL